MEGDKALIACEIFKHELAQVLVHRNEIDIYWLDAALHADTKRMKVELEGAIAKVMGTAHGGIRLLFGNGCHPDLCNIAEGCGARVPGVNNCIQAIIGPDETKRLEANRTMVVTPAWITAWPSIMAGLGWDEVDVRINMGRYDRIVLLDSRVVPITDEIILSFYDLVQVPIELEQVNLEYFRNLVSKVLGAPDAASAILI